MNTITRRELIAQARELIGTPFKDRGRHPAVGLDCYGLLFHLSSANGLTLPHDVDYSGARLFERACQIAAQLGTPVTPEQAKPGDVLLFNMLNRFTHFGLMTDYGLLHANFNNGAICEQAIDARMRSYLKQAYIITGVVDE